MHCSRVLNCTLTSYSPQRASCLSQQMLHEQLVSILLLHPSEHDATPWFLQPQLKGCSAYLAVHFLRDSSVPLSPARSECITTNKPNSFHRSAPQHRQGNSLSIHTMNTHTTPSLMLKLMMSNNVVSNWGYFGEQLILQSCNAWIFLLAWIVSLRDQLMSFSSQLVIWELNTQYTKDAIRGQLQKPQEEFCGSGKDRNLFSAQEALPCLAFPLLACTSRCCPTFFTTQPWWVSSPSRSKQAHSS